MLILRIFVVQCGSRLDEFLQKIVSLTLGFTVPNVRILPGCIDTSTGIHFLS